MTRRQVDATRDRILKAAVKCFSRQGYASASVDEVCTAAGVSKGAFYYHFKSKQELFLALLNGWLGGLDVAMASMRRATIPETMDAMTSMLPLALAAGRGRLAIWLEFWLQATREHAVWKATVAPYRHYRDQFAGLIEEGIAEGTLRRVDSQAAAQAILSMAVGLFLQGILDPRGANWQKTAHESMEILMSGLTNPGRTARPRRRRP